MGLAESECPIVSVPFQPRERVASYLALADVLVQPGRLDDFNGYRFPSKLPEFFAMGRPVILPATNIGLRIEDGKDALLAYRGDAIELAEKSPQWKVEIPPAEKRQALRRARQRAGLFKGVQLLWVDDHPENNLNERRMFRQLGVDIDSAKSTEEALAMLAAAQYDVVFSDMARGDDADAGLDLLRQMLQRGSKVPLILYLGSFDADVGTPPRAFGATNRPDELLHLTLDALERNPAAD